MSGPPGRTAAVCRPPAVDPAPGEDLLLLRPGPTVSCLSTRSRSDEETVASDDRRPPQPGHAPHRPPFHRLPGAARSAEPLHESAAPRLQPGDRTDARHSEQNPHAQIDRDQREREPTVRNLLGTSGLLPRSRPLRAVRHCSTLLASGSCATLPAMMRATWEGVISVVSTSSASRVSHGKAPW